MKLKVFRAQGSSAQSEIEKEVNTWFARHKRVKVQQFGTACAGPNGEGYMVAFLYQQPLPRS